MSIISTFRGKNINTGKQKVSDEELHEALRTTDNIRQALLKVGLTPKGLNYKRAAALLNVGYERPIDVSNSQYGTYWINNGTVNKKVKKDNLDAYLEVGWKKGRINTSLPPSNKGTFWVTNGFMNKMVKEVPSGFWKGKS